MADLSTLQKIERAIQELGPDEQAELAERLISQLGQRKPKAPPGKIRARDFYGIGKHVWGYEDAQDYINRLREDRECP